MIHVTTNSLSRDARPTWQNPKPNQSWIACNANVYNKRTINYILQDYEKLYLVLRVKFREWRHRYMYVRTEHHPGSRQLSRALVCILNSFFLVLIRASGSSGLEHFVQIRQSESSDQFRLLSFPAFDSSFRHDLFVELFVLFEQTRGTLPGLF